MNQEFKIFIPDTVDEQIDEQIERMSDLTPTNRERSNIISGEQLVPRLHHLYQTEQRDRALSRGWERIVQVRNSSSMHNISRLEQADTHEDNQSTILMNGYSTIPMPIPAPAPVFIPAQPKRSTKKPRRVMTLAQTIAAVVIVGAVLASFLALIGYHTGMLGAKEQSLPVAIHSTQPVTMHSIVVTVALNGAVYAFQAGSQQVLWNFSKEVQKDSYISSAADPIVQDNVVYVVIRGQMYALNANDGKILWQQNLAVPGFVQSRFNELVSERGILYVSGIVSDDRNSIGARYSGNVYAIRATDGKILWRYQEGTLDPLLTVSNGSVYVTSHDTLLALSSDTGEIRWRQSSIVPNTVNTDNTAIYVAGRLTNDKLNVKLFALSAQDGHVLWSIPITHVWLGLGYSLKFVIHQGTVILGFEDYASHIHYFCAYKTSDGTSAWCSPKAPFNGPGISGYTLMNDTIYAGVGGMDGLKTSIEALNAADGKLLWSTPSSIVGDERNPVIMGLGGVVYVLKGGASDGGVSAFDGQDGREIWHVAMKNPFVLMIAFGVGPRQ